MLLIALTTLIVFVLVFGAAWLLVMRRSSGLPDVMVSFGETQIRAELAVSTLDRARGLSHRDALEEGRGMLFGMGSARRHSFWMQGMRFPIDIIWLRDSVVVDVTPNVAPEPGLGANMLRTYAPLLPADEVLEVPAGYAAAQGITTGSRMRVTQE